MVEMALRDQLLQQPWYAIAVEAVLFLAVFSYFKRLFLQRVYKARSPKNFSDRWFGFWLLYDLLKKGKEGIAIEDTRTKFVDAGCQTATLRVAGKRLILTHDAENIKAILATQFNEFILGNRHQAINVLLGDGIFTLDGEGWKHSRAMLRPQFAREQVGHVDALEPRLQSFIQQVRLHDGKPFDIQTLFFQLTVDSGTDFLFGESCDSLSEGLKSETSNSDNCIDPELRRQFADAFNYSQTILNVRLTLQDLFFLGTTSKFKRCNKIVHEFTEFYVNKALQASEKELENNSRGGYVFLYELLKETRDPLVLRNQCLNILLAARDTTAGLLSFTFFELARNPEVFKKLREAIVAEFGEGENVDTSLITFSSLKKCEYLKWVLNETLRMYPSVPRNFRVATKNTTLPRGGGADETEPIFIEKGTNVTYSVYNTHRNEKEYGKDANVFRPERWGEPSAKKFGWNFVPFNGGPRICLGQQFALTEASYTVVRLLQTFNTITSEDSEYPPKLLAHLTMSLMDGANITLKRV